MANKSTTRSRTARGAARSEFADAYAALDARIDQLADQVGFVAAKIDKLLDRVSDNSDTSPEQVEQYLNKIGRMIASRKFVGAERFLRSVYTRVEDNKHITKRQMGAVDRIDARGSAPASAPFAEYESWDGPDPWGND